MCGDVCGMSCLCFYIKLTSGVRHLRKVQLYIVVITVMYCLHERLQLYFTEIQKTRQVDLPVTNTLSEKFVLKTTQVTLHYITLHCFMYFQQM